jgi:AcrR family transcriptional regulator
MRKNLVRMQHADRRKLLLSHAVNIFALKGYNFTTRELAKNAGVSVTLLHKYFDTKNGIIKAVLDEIFEY